MFHESDEWVGGDGAITVDLDDGRILWLFGDSRVAPDGERDRDEAFFLSNTVAIQHDPDPTRASLEFYWRTQEPPSDEGDDLPDIPPITGGDDEQGDPRPFIPDEEDGEIAHWPGHGTMVEGELLLFYTRIERGEGPFGFEDAGWRAFLVQDPSGEPLAWELEQARTPAFPFENISIATGSVFEQGDHVYAYASHSHQDALGLVHFDPFLVRWLRQDVLAADLTSPEWYDPAQGAWLDWQDLDKPPEPLFEPGGPGWTVHHDAERDAWIQIQISDFPTGPIELRTAPDPMGPWSTTAPIHEPPENRYENVTTYLAYAHPVLEGADLAVGYSTNTLTDDAHQQDPMLGYPQLTKVHLG